MKGIHGLILAILLGFAGAVFNFLYLVGRSSEVKMEGFVGIADGKNVKRGQRLTDSHLVRVDIPEREAQSLKNFAYSDDARSSLIGQRVWRDLTSGSLVLRQDTKTPVTELSFGQNLPDGIEERAAGVPIDPRKLTTALVQPGDEVDFVVPTGPLNRPTRALPPGRPARCQTGG